MHTHTYIKYIYMYIYIHAAVVFIPYSGGPTCVSRLLRDFALSLSLSLRCIVAPAR